ncbi:prepilin-type N-terminal cleavage/methylation domain-containing protein [Geomonas sp. Red32]|uniref:prepilin-type N-terminal cleavage/methylation domain-containing protein n=1 Tax=Geomonas sp. Red32 TaxID=2912856 RepID=UPI00202CF13B|nr:prepilin-type N-terminal cleavage/methylation domain-containing protein [Geomonas sp. Red32]
MSSSEKGFTMIELLVAVLILSVGLLGLFQSVYVAIGNGMKDTLRAEGMTFGDELMAHEVNQPFTNLSVSQAQPWSRSSSQPRSINNGMAQATYSSVRTHVYVSPSSTDLQIRVTWRYKGAQYSQNLATMVSK